MSGSASSQRRTSFGRASCAARLLHPSFRVGPADLGPWEGLRPQMHRGAGAHSVTVRPVLVEKQLHFPGAKKEKKKKGTYKGDACLQVGGVQSRALGEQGGWGLERRGRCVGLRVQRTGSLRHACFPLLPLLLEVFPSASLSLDIECRQASSRAPLLYSRHLFLSLSLQGGCSPPKASDLRPAETTRRT